MAKPLALLFREITEWPLPPPPIFSYSARGGKKKLTSLDKNTLPQMS
ncbi:integrin alpha-IIb-like protein [Corchorus olitorius]|uniref:Integrin alpha-IIb-like protein n=1 Tax=Corchorus olitorius TaxID=93759 RepID=A0A1R3HKQ6_9ROSI|nr:integrin alpha-IIb-like protein [Corchorus olitorius]